jgi:hypothetical protein
MLLRFQLVIGKQGNVIKIRITAISFLLFHAFQNPVFLEFGNQVIGVLVHLPGSLGRTFVGNNRSPLEILKQLESGTCRPSKFVHDKVSMLFSQLDDATSSACGFLRNLDDALEKESQPCFPVAFIPNLLEKIIIRLPVSFEKVRQIEDSRLIHIIAHSEIPKRIIPRRVIPLENSSLLPWQTRAGAPGRVICR